MRMPTCALNPGTALPCSTAGRKNPLQAIASSRSHWHAVAFGTGATMLFALMTLAVRLAEAHTHAFEVTFFRAVFGLAAVLPVVAWQGPLSFKTRRYGRHFVRSFSGMGSMWCGFWALGKLPMAHVVAISYLAPLIATGLAAFGLRERGGVRQWLALLAGFAGVLLVAKPHEGATNYAGLTAALGAAGFTAWSYVSIRRLVATESAEQIVFWSSVTWVGLAAIPAISVWVEPPLRTWPWLVLAGLAGTGGHLLWARALRLGSVSRITPLSFLQLPLTSALGYLCLRERLDALTITGGAIVFSANLWMIRTRPTAATAEPDPGPASKANRAGDEGCPPTDSAESPGPTG